MELITIILMIICFILLAAVIILSVHYFSGMTQEQRDSFISACMTAAKTTLQAMADGKITSTELADIAKVLIQVVAAFASVPTDTVKDRLAEQGAQTHKLITPIIIKDIKVEEN